MLDALFAKADEGKMMLALINRVPDHEPTGDPTRGDVAAAIEIFNRAQQSHDIVGFSAFKKDDTPLDFVPERVLWPGEDPKIMVRVHHKFIVIDAEGENPIVLRVQQTLAEIRCTKTTKISSRSQDPVEWPEFIFPSFSAFMNTIVLALPLRAVRAERIPSSSRLTTAGAKNTSCRDHPKLKREQQWQARSMLYFHFCATSSATLLSRTVS